MSCYMSCPTCGYFIGQKLIKFEKEKNKILENPDFDEEKKDNLISKLINELGLRRYCCKMRIRTYVDFIDIF